MNDISKKMTKSRGKPPRISSFSLREIFINNKNNLVEDGKIVKSNNPIWQKLAAGTGLLPITLYSYAYSRRFEFRGILLGKETNLVKNCFSKSSIKTRKRAAVFDIPTIKSCKVKIMKLNVLEETDRNAWNNLELQNPFIFEDNLLKHNARTGHGLVNGKNNYFSYIQTIVIVA